MIIGNDIVLNVEDFLGAMINSYLLFAPYADLSYDEIAQLLEEYFCDYIAQYGIVILKLYTKKKPKKEYLLIINIMALKSVIFIPNNFKKV